MSTYREVLEGLRADAESVMESIGVVLNDDGALTGEEDRESALDRLAAAYPMNAHVLRAFELSQSNLIDAVLAMTAATAYYAVVDDGDGAIPIDAPTVAGAVTEAEDAEWRDDRRVTIRDVATRRTVASIPRRSEDGEAR